MDSAVTKLGTAIALVLLKMTMNDGRLLGVEKLGPKGSVMSGRRPAIKGDIW